MQSGPRRISDKMQDQKFIASLPTSRNEAKKLGAPNYLTKPCKHGHYSYRKTASGECAQCSSLKAIKVKQPSSVVRRAQKNWNASEKAKTAKGRWKEKNPKWAWVVSAVGGARTRAKYRNIEFNLTNEYVYSIAGNVCPVLGMELSFGGTARQVPNSASLDKINPSLGYVVGNVAVISFRANTIKSNANSKEIAQVAAWLAEQGC